MERDLSDLLGKRIIVLRGAIDDDVANVVIAKLLFLQSQGSAAPVQLHMSSPGGAVAAALAIRDTIDDLEVPVYTHGLGHVQGVAALVLAHGARRHRTMARHARVTFIPITSAGGVPAAPSELARTETIVTQMIAADTQQSIEQVESDLRASRSFDAEQARAYGLIDNIVG